MDKLTDGLSIGIYKKYISIILSVTFFTLLLSTYLCFYQQILFVEKIINLLIDNSSVGNIIFFISDVSFIDRFFISVNPSIKLILTDFSLFIVDN